MTVPFDHIGEAYDEAFSDREAQREHGRRLITALPAGARVLDHGCGSGVPTARQLVDAGFELVGVDESERMLTLARERVPEARFERRDLRDLGEDLGEFDAVVSYFALLMLPRSEIPGVLSGIAGRLRPGGLLALGMVAGDFDDVEIPFVNGVPIRVSAYPTAAELAEVVSGAGFEVTSSEEVGVPSERGVETQQFVLARRA
ncbi:MAG TPA: methyltransferase domain-containing protein [Pseudonocardia sp.]|nr:methyltransferase domain-containing protein [Pseudonocardia sp.]